MTQLLRWPECFFISSPQNWIILKLSTASYHNYFVMTVSICCGYGNYTNATTLLKILVHFFEPTTGSNFITPNLGYIWTNIPCIGTTHWIITVRTRYYLADMVDILVHFDLNHPNSQCREHVSGSGSYEPLCTSNFNRSNWDEFKFYSMT